jgi:type III restriction enzyme
MVASEPQLAIASAPHFFQPEYLNIFGVPFTFLPHEGGGDQPPPPPTPKTRIEVLPERKGYEIVWPNVIRIDHDYRPTLTLDLAKAKPLTLDAYETPTLAVFDSLNFPETPE